MAPSTRRAKAKKNPEKVEITEEDKNPGAVYVGHIPHGFYEAEMKAYFSQFGDVLAVKLSRSKKSGKSKGYAFIKFRYAAVAKTVAETCNNYLFFNRLLKCTYRPLDELHKDTFKSHPAVPVHKEKRIHNADKSDATLQISNRKAMRRMKQKLKQLSHSGIDIELDDVLTTPQDLSITEVPKDKQLHEDKNAKGRKRARTHDTADAGLMTRGKTECVGSDEEMNTPTPKRRKKMSPKGETEEMSLPTPKRRKRLSPKNSTKSTKGKEVQPAIKADVVKGNVGAAKVSPSVKKLGQNSTKKNKGKVVTPSGVGVRKISAGKRKK